MKESENVNPAVRPKVEYKVCDAYVQSDRPMFDGANRKFISKCEIDRVKQREQIIPP